MNGPRQDSVSAVRSGQYGVYRGQHVRILRGDHRGWLLDLDPPALVPRGALDDRIFVRTWATFRGEKVQVIEVKDGVACLFVDGYPLWAEELDAAFDRNEQACTVTVPVAEVSGLREDVTHLKT